MCKFIVIGNSKAESTSTIIGAFKQKKLIQNRNEVRFIETGIAPKKVADLWTNLDRPNILLFRVKGHMVKEYKNCIIVAAADGNSPIIVACDIENYDPAIPDHTGILYAVTPDGAASYFAHPPVMARVE